MIQTEVHIPQGSNDKDEEIGGPDHQNPNSPSLADKSNLCITLENRDFDHHNTPTQRAYYSHLRIFIQKKVEDLSEYFFHPIESKNTNKIFTE